MEKLPATTQSSARMVTSRMTSMVSTNLCRPLRRYTVEHCDIHNMTHSYVAHDLFMCEMTHSCVWLDSFIRATWLIHTWDMTHSHVWLDSFIRATWLIHVWHDSFIRVTWLVYTCDMDYSYVWHNSFMRVTWLVCTCDMTYSSVIRVTRLIYECGYKMTYSCVRRNSCTCVTCRKHVCDRTYVHMRHDSCIHVHELVQPLAQIHCRVLWHVSLHMWHDSFICETWLVYMCDMSHVRVWHCTFTCTTWLPHMCHWTYLYVRHESFIFVHERIQPPTEDALSNTVTLHIIYIRTSRISFLMW